MPHVASDLGLHCLPMAFLRMGQTCQHGDIMYISYCPPVRGDNPRALALQVYKPWSISYHPHQCRPLLSMKYFMLNCVISGKGDIK